MSDTFTESPDIDPEDLGQVEGEDDGQAVEEHELLDLDEVADRYVTVKVDGEEVTIPLSEALAGYSRQADYTRKTQELATQRQELQRAQAIAAALETDPQGTLELLAQHHGLKLAGATQTAEDEFSWDDPEDAKLAQLDARIRAFEEAQATERLQREIGRLSTKYGDIFDPQEVVTAALRTGSTDLEGTFKTVAFDRLMERQAKATAATAKQKQRVAAKEQAAVVSGGSSASGPSTDVGAVNSISDAWAAAKRQLGA